MLRVLRPALRRILLALPCLALVLATPTAKAEPIELSTRAIALDGSDHLAHRFELRLVGELIFATGFVLESPHPDFGGFSGLAIDCESGAMVAISDKGHYMVARLARTGSGGLRGIARPRIEPLLDLDGRPVDGRMRQDAEEIVVLDDGLLVSFEGTHRLALYDSEPGVLEPRGLPHALETPSGLDESGENKGLEAMTRLADGRLLVLTEGLSSGVDTLAAWVGEPGAWQILHFPITEDFEPTAAATLPDGRVLVLERSYDALSGLARIRISRLANTAFEAGERLEPRELGRLEPPTIVDNMEALAVCPRPRGGAWLYMMSDDNFSAEQETYLLQLVLLPGEHDATTE